MKDIENRWFPPSPHREAVLDFIKREKAHIEERGHNVPPLLVFEDGGVMELPLARFKDGNFSPAEGVTATRQTHYSDVCGTIDEFKKVLEEKPEMAQSHPAYLFELIDDACYMLSRMQGRRGKYREFAAAVASVSEALSHVGGPEPEDAYGKADEIRDFLESKPDNVTEGLQELYELAEGIRDVANNMEGTLKAYSDLSKELGKLYTQIRGSRKWDEG